MEKYDSYTFSDFVNDDDFIRLVKYANPEDEGYWQSWLNTQPGNVYAYQDAKVYLLTIFSAKPLFDQEAEKNRLWENINSEIYTIDNRSVKIRRIRIWSASVAAALCLFVLGEWYYHSRISVTTGYGEQMTVTLPDQSVIKLNSNSQISYYRAWAWHTDREIWLNGEALFEVKHLNTHPEKINKGDRFIAHAGKIDVRVLGTIFNIRDRRNEVLVSLLKGSISVNSINSGKSPLIMKSGDAARFVNANASLIPVSSLDNKPDAWTSRQMELSGMTVAGIIENYEDTYGGRIVVDNPRLLKKRIEGTISLQTPEETLYMLANLLNATVEQRDTVYYLKSK
ncbi:MULTISPECIES: FecR family protein [Mucilaginibacter]|nr:MULTISPECIES: FecR domain-containing protein [Mucilaginibacter]QTE43699.1 FecR domain-containing protein [Mucilaginibacter rubeus]QTE50299.1 FecR domain-containing protein [Mucilaginibacter rubeus]QTE55386.1 FecR domain-containing protein [Mucilaginibacter rubeus]QTE65154.1 FecR domain-containing protein [Mucilaginibacter rubeus]QTF63907.1 FecR domain-containing protein [Mucilaginibacter rubeus]